ncbi:LacI family DNA-binding transcriptional regulator [Actinopolymorpha rutila]|uniref:DNA-binding LacI/PurR family transcriptional regulator n=1 Tax=Actinopolymorpha rutila TaxID=446787 RepID=A0A852ZFN5_9ACTN|nr:DNA-binding LacI/PurR family transcriptional regulator [Actinopolymorpha rutila]
MATIADVARLAGVAPSTVSYVLSNRRSISPQTREAVHQAIRDLDYQPHVGARALRGAATRVLAVSVPSEGTYSPLRWRFVHDLSAAAREHEYDLLLLTGEDSVADVRRVARSRLADGAVLMSVLTDDPRIPVVRELGFPTALLGCPDDPSGLPWCDFDFEGSAAQAVRMLAGAGHRRIGFVASTDTEFREGVSYARRGLAGARLGARDADAELTVIRSSNSPRTLAGRVRRLLDVDDPPSALVTVHDVPGLVEILREQGYRVPVDLPVVAVASTRERPGVPGLPRWELPVAQMTRTAVRLAMAAISGEPGGTGEPGRPGDRGGLIGTGPTE